MAGLWLLDELTRAGHSVVLLEANALGNGQTLAAQGIIHGGLKYTLDGIFHPSAEAIRDMPSLWRDCLRGARQPDLRPVRLRGESCWLWRTDSLRSWLGMAGARFGLQVKPAAAETSEVPPALRRCAGEVLRLDEQVVEPQSLVAALAQTHAERLLKIDPSEGLEFELGGDGRVSAIRLHDARTGRDLELCAETVVFTAGAGNDELRQRVGLGAAMQRRPLHMILARGPLPSLNGHCIDGARTRVTITSSRDASGRCVWQIGGQVAEDGVAMTEEQLIGHTRRELLAVLAALDLKAVEWTAHRIDRAEARMPGGKRPSDAFVRRDGNVITGWPTKLALAPRLARQIRSELAPPAARVDPSLFADWPRPAVASPPWETARTWFADH